MREMMLDTIRDTRLIGPGPSPELSWLVFLLSLVLDLEQLFDRRLHCLGGSMFGLELQSQMKSEKSGASLSLSSDDWQRELSLWASCSMLTNSSSSSSSLSSSFWLVTSHDRSTQPYTQGGVSDIVTVVTGCWRWRWRYEQMWLDIPNVVGRLLV